jgi:sulfatase maturation enzyme AslB (radical SAM superfamily)
LQVWHDWYRRDIGKVITNLFETAVAQWMGKESQLCIYHEFCGKGVAMEHDGSLYSCDHYVYPQYKPGNIMETSSSGRCFPTGRRNSATPSSTLCPGAAASASSSSPVTASAPKTAWSAPLKVKWV